MVGVPGRGGRPRKATAQHIQDGTYRPHRHKNRADIHYEPGEPAKPRNMEPHAEWLWNEIVGNTPSAFLSPIDAPRLMRLCDLWQRWRELADKIKGGSESKEDYRQYLKVGAQWDQNATEFGIGLASRSRIDLHAAEEQETPAEILRRLIGGGE